MSARAWWLIPLTLFLVALVARLVTIAVVPFPATEGSLYYLDVARNLVTGQGLTTDVLWSYATPPLTLPRPAFDLWLPLASLVAAVPMLAAGTGHQVGQLGGVALGALIAPLTWAVTQEAARLNGLDDRRRNAASIAAGLLAAVLGPWLVATAAPDSTVPFTILATISALLMSRLLLRREPGSRAPTWRGGLVLGIALGLTYLARQEVIWLGVTFLVLSTWTIRGLPAGTRLRTAWQRLVPVVVGGLLIVVPWFVRQQLTFGGSATAQALENMFLLRNEQIFSIHDRPTLGGWLGQGLPDLLAAPVRAMGTQLTDTILLGAFPVGVVGILSAVLLRRSLAFRRPTALVVLLLSGSLTFLATAMLFPVATLWGTFLHASGPLLVGLIVASTLGADACMARVSRARGWPKVNVIVGPAALLALALPVAAVQLAAVVDSAESMERRLAAVRAALPTADADDSVLMSDHPMSLAWVLGRPTMVLPDDPPATLAELARETGVRTLIVFDERAPYPDALLDPSLLTCLSATPERIGTDDQPTWLFRIDPGCVTP